MKKYLKRANGLHYLLAGVDQSDSTEKCSNAVSTPPQPFPRSREAPPREAPRAFPKQSEGKASGRRGEGDTCRPTWTRLILPKKAEALDSASRSIRIGRASIRRTRFIPLDGPGRPAKAHWRLASHTACPAKSPQGEPVKGSGRLPREDGVHAY